MPATDSERLEALERRVAKLEALVAGLTQNLQPRAENSEDRRAVTTKTRYDWQG